MSLAEPVRLTEGQVAASGAVLARAFANDPFFTYVLSDPAERERLMPPLMEAWTRYGLLFGEVYVTAGPVEASAVWLAPGALTEERRKQAGLTAVVSAFSVGARERYDAIVQHQGLSARPYRPSRTGISPLLAWTPHGRASAWEASCCERGSYASIRTGSSAGCSPMSRGTCRSTSGTVSRLPPRGTSPRDHTSGICDGGRNPITP